MTLLYILGFVQWFDTNIFYYNMKMVSDEYFSFVCLNVFKINLHYRVEVIFILTLAAESQKKTVPYKISTH